MLAKVDSAALHGIEAFTVQVEVDMQPGMPQWTLVGLPDTAVQESRERVRTAIRNVGLDFPLRKLTINLPPTTCRLRWAFWRSRSKSHWIGWRRR
jgi:magnesium chelatase family protein